MEETQQKPAVKVTPLSQAAFGPLTVLVVQKDLEQEGTKVHSGIFVSIRRTVTNPEDDPNMIPIIELPALEMLLKNIAEPAMSVRSFKTAAPARPDPVPPAPIPVAPPNRKERRTAGKKDRK